MGNLCSQPRNEEIMTRPSVAFKQAYKNVAFENINGDICDQSVDAIVNTANNQLSHNNGLANSLIVKGGQTIQEESDKVMETTDGILEIGTAVVTSAGNLKAKYIIHVVSPVWNGGENGEEEKLAQAIFNTLNKAKENKIATLAVPSLSGGSFGFPKQKCAELMVKNCLEYLDNHPETTLKSIKFVNMDAQTVRMFKAELEKHLGANPLALPEKLHKTADSEDQDQAQTNQASNGDVEEEAPQAAVAHHRAHADDETETEVKEVEKEEEQEKRARPAGQEEKAKEGEKHGDAEKKDDNEKHGDAEKKVEHEKHGDAEKKEENVKEEQQNKEHAEKKEEHEKHVDAERKPEHEKREDAQKKEEHPKIEKHDALAVEVDKNESVREEEASLDRSPADEGVMHGREGAVAH
jgi:putative ATPase